jgi:alpha-mannosidase
VHNPKPGVKNYKTGGPITIHVVPHSHDDVGWLKTVEQYFDGSRRDIQWTGVRTELTSVIDALWANPDRKFSEVEMKFFSMWWDLQSDTMKDRTRKLVENGQLELINGGWSMHDEACPIYEDMIENMMMGHNFILQNFGVKPRIGWQIDPFGHSNTNARFFAEMGFDAWFFSRIDYQDKNKRMNDLEMEWVWRPNPQSLGNDT